MEKLSNIKARFSKLRKFQIKQEKVENKKKINNKQEGKKLTYNGPYTYVECNKELKLRKLKRHHKQQKFKN